MSGTDPRPMTPSDLRAIKYFFVEKGDLTRWTSWPEKHEAFKAQFPEIHAKMQMASAAFALVEQLTKEVAVLLEQAEKQAEA